MIGVYDYTVLATYLSLLFGLGGIYQAAEGNSVGAVAALMLAGLLDGFDGRIARTKKNRSAEEKRFGIQIDSLNDLICFGVLPAAIGCALGERPVWFLATMAFYVLCALIRLAYFNVSEEERQDTEGGARTYYLGMPVTTVSVLAPLVWILTLVLPLRGAVVYAAALFVFGVLFIAPVRVKKPHLGGILVMAGIGAAEAAAIAFLLLR